MLCIEIQNQFFFMIISLYTMYRENNFIYGMYRDLKKTDIKFLISIPYINKVLFIHTMHRDSKSIVFFMITTIYTMYRENNILYGKYNN